MRFQLRQRDRRALLILGVSAAVYLATTLVVFPIYDRLKTASAVAADKEEQLQKYRRALTRKGRYEQLLPASQARIAEAEKILLRGDNVSLASAELQSLVEEIAKNANLTLSQRSVAAPKKIDDFYNEMTMGLVFEATPSQLLGFLSGLRSAPKYLTLKTLQISPTQPLTEAPKSGEFQKIVRVNVTVGGLLTTVKGS